MTPLHTHYDNLKVARNAPPEVIRAAYKTLCRKFHPDHHPDQPNATHTFQLISAAYGVLSDPDRRRSHDKWIAETEAEQQLVSNGSGNRARHYQMRRRGDRRRQSDKQAEQQFAELVSRLRRPSRQLAFWGSMLLISAMLIVIYHA
jgi:DnaJ-class molecular chaperone